MPDPDLEMGGGGGGGAVIQTLRKGGAGSKKILFRPLGPQFGLKLREGRRQEPRAPPLDPPLEVILKADQR